MEKTQITVPNIDTEGYRRFKETVKAEGKIISFVINEFIKNYKQKEDAR